MICAVSLLASAGVPSRAQDIATLKQEPHRDYPNGVVGLYAVPYKAIPGYRPLTMDLYIPSQSTGPKPAVIQLHGGGWIGGFPGEGIDGPFVSIDGSQAALAARGYVVAGVAYRMSAEARFPAALEDAKAAVRYLRKNAARLGIDPNRIGVWGNSAGGHLAALMGTTCGVKALEGATGEADFVSSPATAMLNAKPNDEISSCVQAVVDFYGPIDLAAMDGQAIPGTTRKHNDADSAESKYLGCTLPACPADVVARANPLTFIDSSDAPVLIVHGDRDFSVPPGQSREFYEALRAKGVSAELQIVPGADHGFRGATTDQLVSIRDRVFAFFDRTLKGK